jgi:hypothetical protein
LPVDAEEADQLVVLEHRHPENRPDSTELDCGHGRWHAFDVRRVCRQVGDLHRLLRLYHAAKAEFPPTQGVQGRAPAFGDERRRRVMGGSKLKCLAVTQIQIPEVGLADPCRIGEHRLEDGRQLAGRG